MKRLIYLSAVVVAAAVIAGCGGSSSHGVDTPYYGSVYGVGTRPYDGDSNVGIDTWIEVFWPDPRYDPPSRFTFRLEREVDVDRFEAVNTYVAESHPDEAVWWFAPEHNLQYDTCYRITITDDYGDRYRAYFVTEPGRSRGAATAAKSFKPENAKTWQPTGSPAVEHTIVTERK